MTEEIKRILQETLNQVSGLECILVTDRDGVELVKVSRSDVPNSIFKKPTQLLPLFIQCSDQAGKLQLGKNKAIISMYKEHNLVQLRYPTLVATFFGNERLNIGHILSLRQRLFRQLEPLAEIAY